MGAGLERLSWITMGSPTSYDATFGPVFKKLVDIIGIDIDSKAEFLSRYFRIFSENYSNYQNDPRILKTNIAKELGLSYEAEKLSCRLKHYLSSPIIQGHYCLQFRMVPCLRM